ncbi:MAG: hypothetical protein E6575_27125, partial [Bradyrhizobium sp.]|nr:hypothetical protein [Bradyrhizobium sp.]
SARAACGDSRATTVTATTAVGRRENNLDPEFRLSGDVIAARSNPVLYDCRGGGRTSSAFGH